MSIIKTHKDLDIWKRGMKLVEQVYLETNQLPKEEAFCLTQQIRRAAISYPSNIAEGGARASHKDFLKFLYIALGSLSELETQMTIAQNLKYLKSGNSLKEIEILRKMTLNFIKYLSSKNNQAK
jgi:four helix bundle protein